MAPFDEARIASATGGGRIVLVKFTAKWCLSCQWVDRAIYNDRDVAEELSKRSVLVMVGDVTNDGMPAEGLLYERLKGAPPLTAVFPPGGGPVIRLAGEFSKSDLLQALDAADGRG